MVIFFGNDIVFQSKISGAATAAGMKSTSSANVEALQKKVSSPDDVKFIIIDLGNPGTDLDSIVPTLRTLYPKAKIVAYGPHVQEENLSQAQSLGCDLVLTRGQFNRDVMAILQ